MSWAQYGTECKDGCLQLLHTISIRSMNIERSMLRPTAPGMASETHKTSVSNDERHIVVGRGGKLTVEEGWPAASGVELCGGLV